MHVFHENSSVRRICVALVFDSHGFVDPCVIEAARQCDCVTHPVCTGRDSEFDALHAEGRVFAVRGDSELPSRVTAGGGCRARTFGGPSLLEADARGTPCCGGVVIRSAPCAALVDMPCRFCPARIVIGACR